MTPRQIVARRFAVTGWVGLAVLQPLWHLGWQTAHAPVGAILILSLVPLALPLLAWRRPSRVLLWAGVVALLYFCHGVAEAWSLPGDRLPALLEVGFSLLLIGSLGAGIQRRL